MRKFFKILAFTQKGRDAILENYDDRKNMKPLERVLFKKLFDVVLLPGSLEFQGKTLATGFVDSDSMINTMSDGMKTSGCLEGVDFRVEVSLHE